MHQCIYGWYNIKAEFLALIYHTKSESDLHLYVKSLKPVQPLKRVFLVQNNLL